MSLDYITDREILSMQPAEPRRWFAGFELDDGSVVFVEVVGWGRIRETRYWTKRQKHDDPHTYFGPLVIDGSCGTLEPPEQNTNYIGIFEAIGNEYRYTQNNERYDKRGQLTGFCPTLTSPADTCRTGHYPEHCSPQDPE